MIELYFYYQIVTKFLNIEINMNKVVIVSEHEENKPSPRRGSGRRDT